MARPVYEIADPKENPDGTRTGISQMAYTATPAIVIKGVAFGEVKKELRFTDELQLRVAAPALIPMEIYRFEDDMGEFDIKFTEQKVRTLATDFMKNRGKQEFNIDHNRADVAPSFLVECWIIEDPETDLSRTHYGIKGLTKGTFFTVSQFTDKEYFLKEIIEKDRTGLSIEGFLGLQLAEIKKEIKQNMAQDKSETNAAENTQMEALMNALSAINDKLTKLEQPKSSEPVVETKAAEAPAQTPADKPQEAPAIDEAAILALVQPKLEELYKEIAQLKTAIEAGSNKQPETDMVQETQMSSMHSLLSLQKAKTAGN